MFATLFVKKRITHKVLAKQFVHKTLRAVDETFEDFLDAIYNDSELEPEESLMFNFIDTVSPPLIVMSIFCDISVFIVAILFKY